VSRVGGKTLLRDAPTRGGRGNPPPEILTFGGKGNYATYEKEKRKGRGNRGRREKKTGHLFFGSPALKGKKDATTFISLQKVKERDKGFNGVK